MPLIESLPSQVQIAVPGAPVINMEIVRPWTGSMFFTGMAGLLNRNVFNATQDFMPPISTPVDIVGSAVPGSTLVVTVNNINQNPDAVIAADPDTGEWSTTVLFGPGPNTVVAQYTTPS